MESEKNESCRQFFLEKLQELSEIPFVKKRQEWLAYGERLRQRLEDKSFRIAVVGEFSSGKSTFINALVQQDLLSHATKKQQRVSRGWSMCRKMTRAAGRVRYIGRMAERKYFLIWAG